MGPKGFGIVCRTESKTLPSARLPKNQALQEPRKREGLTQKKHALQRFLFSRPLAAFILLPGLLFASFSRQRLRTGPAGNASDTIYNFDWHVPQYCNSGNWAAMGSSAGGSTTAAAPPVPLIPPAGAMPAPGVSRHWIRHHRGPSHRLHYGTLFRLGL